MTLSEQIKTEIERHSIKIKPIINGTITITIKRGKIDYIGLYESVRPNNLDPNLLDNIV